MGKIKIFPFVNKYWPFLFLLILVSFFYTVNLDKNSRFIWDESRALVDMHRIWENKEITFVGPISSDNLEMFPSLSYYMYLPGAILSGFDPLGSAYMAAFYGVISWIFFTLTIIKVVGLNKKSFCLSLLIASLNPVLTASRWAWNPNLVIFWTSIFLYSLFSENIFVLFLGGLSLGASLYHHYLAVFGIIPALLFLPIIFRNKKSFRKIIAIFLGFLLSTVPFLFFELKNHFFLSSGAFLSANEKSFLSLSLDSYPERIWQSLAVFSAMFVPSNLFIIVCFLFSLVVIFIKYRQDKYLCYSFFSLILSFFLYGFVKTTYQHYQLVQVFLIILFLTRFLFVNKNIFGKLFLTSLLVFSLTNTYQQITSYTWQGDITAVRNVSQHLLAEKEVKTNVAAIQSDDTNLTGQRYRDMALINGKTLDAYNLYPESKVLFVVSGTNDAEKIRHDQAWELESFKGSTITNIWQVSDLPAYLFRFEK